MIATIPDWPVELGEPGPGRRWGVAAAEKVGKRVERIRARREVDGADLATARDLGPGPRHRWKDR